MNYVRAKFRPMRTKSILKNDFFNEKKLHVFRDGPNLWPQLNFKSTKCRRPKFRAAGKEYSHLQSQMQYES